jgi:hypothetical protein
MSLSESKGYVAFDRSSLPVRRTRLWKAGGVLFIHLSHRSSSSRMKLNENQWIPDLAALVWNEEKGTKYVMPAPEPASTFHNGLQALRE